ncbi:MAG TPA: hypothetical protein DDW71_00465 [Lactobacillus sp.]|nr:hypothetical protein [Lactobacillus sp.]
MDLNIYKKGDSKAAFTGDETTGVAITGLAAGTSVAAGDYQASAVDPTGKMAESDKVDVPAFTVNKAKAPAPTNLKVTPTNDGATVTAQ